MANNTHTYTTETTRLVYRRKVLKPKRVRKTGWRFLKQGEIIKKGDQFLGWLGNATPRTTSCIGDTITRFHEKERSYRRRLR